MKKSILLALILVMGPSSALYAQSYHRFTLAYTHADLAEFNEFISSELSTTFSERGTQIGYHYLTDLGFITNMKMGLGVNIDYNWAKRKGLILKTNVYLFNFSADLIIEYARRLFGPLSLGIGVSGGVSASGYLRMKLLKKNMWRNYWDIEPYVSLSVDLGYLGSISMLAGYHFRTALGEWTEGNKVVKNSEDILGYMHYLRLALGFSLKF